jgi:hypothetical protein
VIDEALALARSSADKERHRARRAQRVAAVDRRTSARRSRPNAATSSPHPAPQVAAAMDYNDTAEPGPPAIDMSDGPMGDESYWMSREELAEKLAEEETARG